MVNVLLVGVGGFLGTISRFRFTLIIRQYVAHPFPVATLTVNLLGSVLIGLLFEYFKQHHLLPMITSFFFIGFLGSFTTFSAFSFETIELLEKNKIHIASANVIGNIVLCLGGVVIGGWIGNYFKI